MTPLLEIKQLSHTYNSGRTQWGWGHKQKLVLKQINLTVHAGMSLGLIGESGSGKSTLARLIMGLEDPKSGQILWEGKPLPNHRRDRYQQIQLVFQNSRAAMNPRKTVQQILTTPLQYLSETPKAEYGQKIIQILKQVGLSEDFLNRYPHELSGGQAQRIGIAKALICRPRLLVLDEPTSALDVSVQAQILNLLKQLQQDYQLTLLFISHDLTVVEYMCDYGVVLKSGELVEQGAIADLYHSPQTPYVQALMHQVQADLAIEKI